MKQREEVIQLNCAATDSSHDAWHTEGKVPICSAIRSNILIDDGKKRMMKVGKTIPNGLWG